MTKETMPAGTTSGTPQVLLAHHLKQLKLPTVLREYDKVARECARDGVDHPRDPGETAPPVRPHRVGAGGHQVGVPLRLRRLVAAAAHSRAADPGGAVPGGEEL